MLLLGGVGYYLLVLRSKTTQGKGIFAWRQVALCILMLLGIAGGSYLTSGELYAVNKEFGVSAMLFAAGILLATAWLGEGGELFRKAERTDSTRGLTRKHIVISLLLHSAIFMAICFFTLQVPLSQKLLWTALSPFVPAAAGVYASYTWFLIDGPPQVFSSSADITGNVASEQARLYLGILFQYLTLGCLSAIVLACRNRRVVSLLCSHLLLLCYWLPTVWLMRQISAMFLGS